MKFRGMVTITGVHAENAITAGRVSLRTSATAFRAEKSKKPTWPISLRPQLNRAGSRLLAERRTQVLRHYASPVLVKPGQILIAMAMTTAGSGVDLGSV